jgi:hypothetical protein
MRHIEAGMETFAYEINNHQNAPDEINSRRSKARFVQFYPEIVKDVEVVLH